MPKSEDYGYPTDDPFLAVVDTETNGLHEGADIIEIAVITLHPATFQTVSEFHSLVKPTSSNSVGRTDIHNISMDMLSDAPSFSELAFCLRNELEGKYMISHNIDFDKMMLKSNFTVCGVKADLGKGICTYKLTGKNLASAASAFGIPFHAAHSALADARVAATLFRLNYKLALKMNVEPICIPGIESKDSGVAVHRGIPSPHNPKLATFRQKRIIAKGFRNAGNLVPELLLSSISRTEAKHLIYGASVPVSVLQNIRRTYNEPATERQKIYAYDLMRQNGIRGINVENMSKTEVSKLTNQLQDDPSRIGISQNAGCFTFQNLALSVANIFFHLTRPEVRNFKTGNGSPHRKR